MMITEKGQVTIPLAIREQFDLLPHTEVDFIVEGDKVILVKRTRENLVNALAKMRGSSDTNLSTEDIMKLTRGDDDDDSSC